ncbi:MAG: hypothetical protein H6845_02705 [Alphaproteobacteria bacterium]|nr:MAG: hypothetical protein H6845_02705 [Alphaproteobacteria bacterium]
MNLHFASLNKTIEEALTLMSCAIVRDFNEIQHVSYVNRPNFISHYIYKTNLHVSKMLHAKQQEYSIISKDFEYKGPAEFSWVIHPLSGYDNFLRGIPHFSCAISIFHNDTPVSVRLLDPIKQEVFFAEKSRGCLLNGKKVLVSKQVLEKDSLISTYNVAVPKSLESISTVSFRCPMLDLAYTACGRIDLCMIKGDMYEWLPGKLLIEEANGVFDIKDDLCIGANNYYSKRINSI